MGDMAEDRIYADRRGKTDLYVGAGLGLTLVAVSDDRVGRFRLVRRGAVRSVTADDNHVWIAAEDDVYRSAPGEQSFEALEFGPADAVAVAGGLLAAGPDGEIARYRDGTWNALGTVDAVRAIDGDWIGGSDGVYRVVEKTLEGVGLDVVNDVASEPGLAATDEGLYHYTGEAWQRERTGRWSVVAGTDNRAHAVGPEGLVERTDGEWRARSVPVEERVVDVAYGRGLLAVTDAGTILVDPAAAKDGAAGWRTRSLGLTDVTGMAVRTSPV